MFKTPGPAGKKLKRPHPLLLQGWAQSISLGLLEGVEGPVLSVLLPQIVKSEEVRGLF